MSNSNTSTYFFFDRFLYKKDAFLLSIYMRRELSIRNLKPFQIALRYLFLNFIGYRSLASRLILPYRDFKHEVLNGTRYIWMVRFPAHCSIKAHGLLDNRPFIFSQRSFDALSDIHLTQSLNQFIGYISNYYSVTTVHFIEVDYFFYRNAKNIYAK